MSDKEMLIEFPKTMDILNGNVQGINVSNSSSDICQSFINDNLSKLKELLPEGSTNEFYTFKDVEEEKKWHEHANNFFKFLLDNDNVILPYFVGTAIQDGLTVYKLPFNAKKTTSMMDYVEKHQEYFIKDYKREQNV